MGCSDIRRKYRKLYFKIVQKKVILGRSRTPTDPGNAGQKPAFERLYTGTVPFPTVHTAFDDIKRN